MYSELEIANWAEGKIHRVGTDGNVSNQLNTKVVSMHGASIDTRTLVPGNIFFALKGEQIDGHAFVATAFEKGAALAVVSNIWFESVIKYKDEKNSAEAKISEGVYLVVKDVELALQKIAKAYRQKLQIPIVAVTGSNGKTTTKNMIRAVLATKYRVCATKGNFNNHLGLPLSILSITDKDQVGVFEIGMNHPGEILPLCEILDPNIGVITGIGTAHIEFFMNTNYSRGPEEGIAREKGSLFTYIAEKYAIGQQSTVMPTCIFPKNDSFADLLTECAKGTKISTPTTENEEEIKNIEALRSHGFVFSNAKHMLQNALLAIAVGKEFGISESDAIQALSQMEFEKGRFMEEIIQTKNGPLHIIDDTYNANPDSVCAAILAISNLKNNAPGYSIDQKTTTKTATDSIQQVRVVLGGLREQGDYLEKGYQRIYKMAVQAKIDELILCDIDEKYFPAVSGAGNGNTMRVHHVPDHATCATYIEDTYTPNEIILFKGSRGARMEEVVGILSVV